MSLTVSHCGRIMPPSWLSIEHVQQVLECHTQVGKACSASYNAALRRRQLATVMFADTSIVCKQ